MHPPFILSLPSPLPVRPRLWWLLCAPCRGCCFFYFILQAAAYYFYLCFQILSCSHLDCPSPCAPSRYFTFGTFPGQQQQTHVLLACFSCCFPATRFVAQPLYCLSVCQFVGLSICLSLSLECMDACMYVYLYACVSVGLLLLWRQSRRHFQDILLAALSQSLSPSPFHLLCRLLLLLLLPTCLCCCCLSRISTWSILAICWSAIISQWKAHWKHRQTSNKKKWKIH